MLKSANPTAILRRYTLVYLYHVGMAFVNDCLILFLIYVRATHSSNSREQRIHVL
jgi:hypothetical protein